MTTANTPSGRLAQFISNLMFENVPEEAVRMIERSFLDTVGVTLAGLEEGAGATAATAMGGECLDGTASVLGTGTSASPCVAAFVNGTAGHGLDFDDSTSAINGHPSVTMVPALLAAVGLREGATGADLVTAYAAGFETQRYLAAPVLKSHYRRGWHATSTFGTFGAAASVAHLLDLEVAEIEHCLNAAASLPAGIKANFGTMTKPMHAGHAARSGLTAALLAAEGFTAAQSAIDTEYGFLDLYGGTDEPGEWPALGESWGLLEHGIDLKKFPCCYFTHAAASGAIWLGAEHDLSLAVVDEITVEVSGGAAETASVGRPDSGLAAKFSFPYVVSRAIEDGELTLAMFLDDAVSEFIDGVDLPVSVLANDEIFHNALSAKVTVATVDGDTYETYEKYPPGRHDSPLSHAELRRKFEMCASRSLASGPTATLRAQLDDLRSVPDAAELFEHL